MTPRLRNIVSGLIALAFVTGITAVGVNFSFGYFDRGYEITASFDAAGQGLIINSDIKVRGVNVGRVTGIELRDGRARVTMFIDEGRDIPSRTSVFTIRPKTLFGEKFIDVVPGADEQDGPFFEDGDAVPTYFDDPDDAPGGAITDADGVPLRVAGGFELERVLSEAFPLLQEIDPAELMTVLNTLADSGDGLGEAINRQIVNGEQVLDVAVRHDADTRQFLSDLALLSGELGDRADDLIAGARDLNLALPVLTENGDAFRVLLEQTERLSDDLADLLLANQDFITANYGPGQQVLDVAFANRDQVVPLVIGLRQYLQTLAQAARIPVGDGTFMGAVKGLFGGDSCGFLPCPGVEAGSAPATADSRATPAPDGTAATPELGPVSGIVSTGTDAVRDLLMGLLR